MVRTLVVVAGAAIGFLASSQVADAAVVTPVPTPTPMRQLVYSVVRDAGQNVVGSSRQSTATSGHVDPKPITQTYVASGDEVPQTSANAIENNYGGAPTDLSVGTGATPMTRTSGDSQSGGYAAAPQATGTVTVDLMRQQTDGGYVVIVAEHGKDRDSPPATCVVYGNTQVICDPAKQLNPEEYTLLRFLGSDFVDLNRVDAKQHWSPPASIVGQNVTADYTIAHNDNGVLTIDEILGIKQSANTSTAVKTTVAYDFARSLPTSIDEHVTQTQDAGAQGTWTQSSHTVMQLVSDSNAKT